MRMFYSYARVLNEVHYCDLYIGVVKTLSLQDIVHIMGF